MDTGIHETDLDKVALAVESTKLAKRMTVSDEGVGEDMNINVFCWKDNKLVSILQLKQTFSLHRDERIHRLALASCLMRQGWGIDEFTLVAEGYCSMKPSETKDYDLAQLFASNNSPVSECISFTHISDDDVLFVSVPYSIEIGRVVEFGNALWYSGVDVLRDLAYPAVLKASLRLSRVEIIEEEMDMNVFFSKLAEGLSEIGFETFYREAD